MSSREEYTFMLAKSRVSKLRGLCVCSKRALVVDEGKRGERLELKAPRFAGVQPASHTKQTATWLWRFAVTEGAAPFCPLQSRFFG